MAAPKFSLDGGSEGGFLKFFHSIPERPSTTVCFFDRADYYTVHGEAALLASKELFHTNSIIKYLGRGDNKLPSVALSKPNFEKFIRHLLLVKQYRVEILRCNSKSSNDWKVAFKASPGNLQQLENALFANIDMTSSTCVIAAKLTNQNGQRLVGVAYIEPCLHRIGVLEFIENDLFSNLEALLVQLSPKECVLVAHDNSNEATKLRQTLIRSNVLITERKKSEFNEKDIIQDLNRLLKLEPGTTSASLSQIDLHHAMCSLAALIKYLELLAVDSNFGAFNIVTFDLSQYLCLDASAARALNLDPQPGEAPNMCLWGLLNQCMTAPGQRLLGQWIKQPLMDKSKIVERQDLVEVIVSDIEVGQSLHGNHLKCIPDLFRISRKFQKGTATLQDCVRVYQAVKRLPELSGVLEGYSGQHSSLVDGVFIQPLKELSEDFGKYVELIETTVDLEMADQHQEFVIRPSFDETLTNLRSQMDDNEAKIHSLYRKVAKELGLETQKTIKLESNSQLGYFLRVTKKVEKCLRGQRRFTILETRNDGVRFTTTPLQSLSEEYLSLRDQYNTTQQSLVEEVLQIATGYVEPIQVYSDLVAQLDVLTSFARVATTAPIPYVRPTITERGQGDIVLEGCRHPCLEVQDDICFMANDVSLLRGKDMFQIITGPNMGGKSTYIRQIGVIVLMAQIGCYVPCRSATISIVDRILARVGAGDSQLKGVSTFMAEMLETASILKSATKDSLVIIDELGRGTSTYDGFGLAWAISEYIAKETQCFCLFATHFHELTSLADEVATVTNRHVTALTTDDALTLLYRVKQGVCDQSFGIHVAELAHFPSRVIEHAKMKASELEVLPITTIDEDIGEPLAKRRKADTDEGERLIEEFLFNVHKFLQTKPSEEHLKLELEKMRGEILAKNNSYIQAVLFGKKSV